MRTLLLAALVASGTVAAVSVPAPADARQGCGKGFHRIGNGRCVANRRGQFYRGYGYWDGQRYWKTRYRYRNTWRYR
jgi:hypothetical protein